MGELKDMLALARLLTGRKWIGGGQGPLGAKLRPEAGATPNHQSTTSERDEGEPANAGLPTSSHQIS
jgi:hypothetical protein